MDGNLVPERRAEEKETRWMGRRIRGHSVVRATHRPIRATLSHQSLFSKLLLQTCSASGFPQAALYWLKDGQPLRTGARIRAVSRERISVMSVAREDRGMYQCFVRNEYEMAQGIAELRLGGESLFVHRLRGGRIPVVGYTYVRVWVFVVIRTPGYDIVAAPRERK